ncbi:hypothetical protein EF834_08615 [Rhodococcus spongiicola]|uniref:Uncharacterized protein n=1 Tax=Rhodococcus spongiicola TaxID=2487352 RepID=A0A3S3E0L8_9NOCA|nr:hypothetical protein EF834_08615 [Rhodococcus spongiicola]
MRRAIVAAALPIAIAASSTGTAHAQETGSTIPPTNVPVWNPLESPINPAMFAPDYAPTPEQRVEDYENAGQWYGSLSGGLSGVITGVLGGGSLAVPIAVAAPWAAGPILVGVPAAFAGMYAVYYGSLGADQGAQMSVDTANQHNVTGQRNPLS